MNILPYTHSHTIQQFHSLWKSNLLSEGLHEYDAMRVQEFENFHVLCEYKQAKVMMKRVLFDINKIHHDCFGAVILLCFCYIPYSESTLAQWQSLLSVLMLFSDSLLRCPLLLLLLFSLMMMPLFRWVLLLLLLVIQLHSLVIEIAFMTSTAVGYPLHRCPSMSMAASECVYSNTYTEIYLVLLIKLNLKSFLLTNIDWLLSQGVNIISIGEFHRVFVCVMFECSSVECSGSTFRFRSDIRNAFIQCWQHKLTTMPMTNCSHQYVKMLKMKQLRTEKRLSHTILQSNPEPETVCNWLKMLRFYVYLFSWRFLMFMFKNFPI